MAALFKALATIEYVSDPNPNKRRDLTCFLKYSFKKGTETVEAHTTLAYLGDFDQECIGDAYVDYEVMVKEIKSHFPFSVTVTGHDMFGRKEDIPVLLVESEIFSAATRFYTFWGICEPSMDVKPSVPKYHISLKFDDLKFMRETPKGTVLDSSCIKGIGIKRLGDCKPIVFESFSE